MEEWPTNRKLSKQPISNQSDARSWRDFHQNYFVRAVADHLQLRRQPSQPPAKSANSSDHRLIATRRLRFASPSPDGPFRPFANGPIADYFNPASQFITTLSLAALKPAFPKFTRNRPSAATS